LEDKVRNLEDTIESQGKIIEEIKYNFDILKGFGTIPTQPPKDPKII